MQGSGRGLPSLSPPPTTTHARAQSANVCVLVERAVCTRARKLGGVVAPRERVIMSHQLARHRAHRDAVWALDWSYDTLCTGSVDGALKSFRVHPDTGALTELVNVEAFPLGVISMVNLNGSVVAASSTDGSIRIVDLKSGKVVQHIRAGPIDCWGLAATAEDVVSGSATGVINFWSLSNGAHVRATETGGTFILCVAVFPNRFLATGHKDGLVRLFTYEDGVVAPAGGAYQSLTGHTLPVRDLCFSPDGQTLYTASDDKTSQCFVTNGGESVGLLRGHSNWVMGVAASKTHVATGSADRSVKLWDADTKECLATFEVSWEVWSVAFCGVDGRMLAAGTSSGDVFTYAVAVEG